MGKGVCTLSMSTTKIHRLTSCLQYACLTYGIQGIKISWWTIGEFNVPETGKDGRRVNSCTQTVSKTDF